MSNNTYGSDQFNKILKDHYLYLQGDPAGKRANLRGADLSGADLSDANLSDANLRYADLRYANLRYANLHGADLSGADLYGANLENSIMPEIDHLPKSGKVIGYKKVQGKVVLKLEVPEDAARTGSWIGRKCRAGKVKVLEALDLSGAKIEDKLEFKSLRDSDFVYRIGEVVAEPGYDADPRVECTQGIHFFVSFEEARDY